MIKKGVLNRFQFIDATNFVAKKVEISKDGISYFKDSISSNIQGFIPAACIADLCEFNIGNSETLLKRLRNVNHYKQEKKMLDHMFEVVIDQ